MDKSMDPYVEDIQQVIEINEREKRKRKKKMQKDEIFNSKVFTLIIQWLIQGKHGHMLKFYPERNSFEVIMTNKKSRRWEESCISLFQEIDSVLDTVFKNRSRPREKYEEDTKGRFRSNMERLERNGYIKKIGKVKIEKSVTKVIYEIISPEYLAHIKNSKGENNMSLNTAIEELKTMKISKIDECVQQCQPEYMCVTQNLTDIGAEKPICPKNVMFLQTKTQEDKSNNAFVASPYSAEYNWVNPEKADCLEDHVDKNKVSRYFSEKTPNCLINDINDPFPKEFERLNVNLPADIPLNTESYTIYDFNQQRVNKVEVGLDEILDQNNMNMFNDENIPNITNEDDFKNLPDLPDLEWDNISSWNGDISSMLDDLCPVMEE